MAGVAEAELLPVRGYRVGAAAVSITPPPGAFLGGYGPGRVSTGQYDELWIKNIVIDDGEVRLAIITIDSIGLTRPDVLRIQRGVRQLHPGTRVVVTSTHTHASPDVVGIWGPRFWTSGRDEAYVQWLINRAVDAVDKAVNAAVPASSRIAGADIPLGWVQNLSEPELLDSRLTVMSFVDNRGTLLATLTNFACHPTVLGPDNTMVSADYVAGFYATMAAAFPGEHLFLQGAIGGWVQPLQGDRSMDLALGLGAQVADRAVALLGESTDNPFRPLYYDEAQVDIPLENWGFRVLIGLGVIERALGGSWYAPQMQTGVSYFTIGDAEFATHPGETSPAYSLQTRRMFSSQHNFVLGLGQDAMGYILKPAYFASTAEYPHADYLTSVSAGAQAGPKIMQALEDLIKTPRGDIEDAAVSAVVAE